MAVLYRLSILLACLFLGCGIPRDPQKTLVSVRGDTLKVGIIENPPWAGYASGGPVGVEVNMVKQIARSLEADIQWFKGGTALFEALKENELHLVIGGITQNDPWSKHVGLTNPYRTTKVLVGVQPGRTPPASIRHLQVGVEEGTPVAAYVRRKGGVPVKVTELKRFQGPVAAPEWQLQAMGYRRADIALHEEKKVFAVMKGENAWVMFLEAFFNENKKQIEQWLTRDHEKDQAI